MRKVTAILSLSPLRARKATTIAIAIVGRMITLERKPSKKKQRTDTKKVAKSIKSDNFTRLSQYWTNKSLMIGWHHNYFVFWW